LNISLSRWSSQCPMKGQMSIPPTSLIGQQILGKCLKRKSVFGWFSGPSFLISWCLRFRPSLRSFAWPLLAEHGFLQTGDVAPPRRCWGTLAFAYSNAKVMDEGLFSVTRLTLGWTCKKMWKTNGSPRKLICQCWVFHLGFWKCTGKSFETLVNHQFLNCTSHYAQVCEIMWVWEKVSTPKRQSSTATTKII
jgi:hypothetical protein